MLICPACRELTDDGLSVHTIERAGDALVCTNCARAYPIVAGVPIVVPDVGAFMRTESLAVLERDVPLEVAELLIAQGADDAPYARLLDHVSVYMDAHWGDRSTPPAPLACTAMLEKVAALPRVEATVELGCSTGRITAALAAVSGSVLGLDLQFATLRRAARLVSGESVAFGRREIGRYYSAAVAAGLACRNVSWVCADAQDPPLVPGMYDRVVALNLLDSVRSPETLLNVLEKLCAPGGEVIVTSPYAWQSGFVNDHERLGAHHPEAHVRDWFTSRGYIPLDEADLPWSLRRDARSSVTYQIHYLRLRKPASQPTV